MPDPRPKRDDETSMTRRSFFEQVPTGVYGAALTYMLGRDVFGGSGLLAAGSPPTTAGPGPRVYDLKPRAPHFEPQAKSVILLFQKQMRMLRSNPCCLCVDLQHFVTPLILPFYYQLHL